MFATARHPEHKLRKLVTKLLSKGKLAEAVDLQRQLCEKNGLSIEDWRALAAMAERAHLVHLELRARLSLAKLERSGSEEWLALAERADAAGLAEEATDAVFHAADVAAISADLALAISLCDRVLLRDPKHAAARRIRGIVAARLDREVQDFEADVESDPREPTHTFTGFQPSGWTGNESIDTELASEDRDITITEWPPSGGAARRRGETGSLQPWPTVLDELPLIFVGQNGELPMAEALAAVAVPLRVPGGEAVFDQGQPCDLLYRLEQGTVRISRSHPAKAELGHIRAGSFFGDVGALSRLPASARVEAAGDCTLSVVSRQQLRNAVHDGPHGQRILDTLKSLYLDAVLKNTPLLVGSSQATREQLVASCRFVSARAGALVIEPGASAPLHVLVTGLLKVTVETGGAPRSLGFLVPGDLLAELAPSPVSVWAVSDAIAMVLERDTLDSLPREARLALARRQERCLQTLRDAGLSHPQAE